MGPCAKNQSIREVRMENEEYHTDRQIATSISMGTAKGYLVKVVD